MEENPKLLSQIINEEKKSSADPAALTRSGKEKTKKRPVWTETPIYKMQMIRDGKLRVKIPAGPITTPQASIQIIYEYLKRLDREVACVLTLDAQFNQIGIATVATGGLTHVDVDPAEVFKVILARDNAASFVFGHNHLSQGDPEPSPEDIQTFTVLKQIGIMLNRPLHDFIVIGRGENHYSHLQRYGYQY